MVLELDGIAEHVAHAWSLIGLFQRKSMHFVTALDLLKYLKHNKKGRKHIRILFLIFFLLILGAPGSGKGTISNWIVR